MNILITGATGFIGENVANYFLKRDHSVHALVRQSSDTSHLDDNIKVFIYLDDISILVDYMIDNKIDIVVHIASLFISEHNSSDICNLFDANIKLGTNILEAMTKAGVTKFINTCTSWQYFDWSCSDYNPTNLYAASKQAFDDIVYYYATAKGINSIGLIIYDSYGPEDRRGKLIAALKEISLSQKELAMSEGNQEIGLTYISDICSGYYIASEMLFNTLIADYMKYSLRPIRFYTLKEVIEIYESVSGCKINILWGKRSYRDREVMYANKLLNILPN